MLLAPESTTAVDVFATTAAAYVMGGGLAGKVLDNCKDVSAFSLILLFTLLASPHRHTFDTQLRGRFDAFAGSSKQSEEA